jgi:serine/threonine-protein kinase
VVLVVTIASALWLLLPDGSAEPNRAAAAPVGGAPGGVSGSPAAGPSAGVSGRPVRSGAAAGAPPAGGVVTAPGGGVATVPGGGVGGPAGPGAGGVGGVPAATPGPAGGGNGDPDPAPTTGRPAPTTVRPTTEAPPPLEERTLSSAGGSVRAACTTLVTAKLVSWTPAKKYKVDDVEEGPSLAPRVVFKHGNDRVRMTVTCVAGIPSAVSLAL